MKGSIKRDREQLAAFDFDQYMAHERLMDGTHLGFEPEGSLTDRDVTVTFRKYTHEIPADSFTSRLEIRIGE